MSSMIVGRLHVSFDRGVKSNKALDLGLEKRPEETASGGLVRGLGTHFRSQEARDSAKLLSREESRVRDAFRRSFVGSPIPGIYIFPERGAGKALLDSLSVDPGVSAHVMEYELALTEAMPPVEILEWAARVKRQLLDVPLGKSKTPDVDGLAMLSRLAACPLLSEDTREEIDKLIAGSKLEAISRVELKRGLKLIDVEIEAPVAPRRVKVKLPETEPEALKSLRRGLKVEPEASPEPVA